MPFAARRLRSFFAFALAFPLCAAPVPAQQLSLQGLRSVNGAGQFNGLRADAAGNLYTLLDAGDGVRLLKFDPTGAQLLGQAQLGQAGDQGVALALDPAGDIYVLGNSSGTGSIAGTAGTAFPQRADGTTNGFLVKFTPALVEQWLTFLGSGKMAVAAVGATATQVVVTGGVFAASLPVTPNGIQQQPLPGSSGDGFVQGYSTAAGKLNFSTYLTGANGDTQAAAVAVDGAGNAYIAGTTTATGFPTINALVPTLLSDATSPVSGFLAKFTPAGDAILFSTYIPGSGIQSAAFDVTSNSLLLSGDVARGLFPVTTVTGPIAPLPAYQTALRIAADGSSVLGSTLLAPSNASAIAAASQGFAVAVTNSNVPNLPLLPVTVEQSMGNAALMQADSNGVVLRTARLGGLPVSHSASASLPALITGIVAAADGSAVASGGLAPTLSSSLLPTERFDLSLVNAPSAALPSAVRDALPTASCNGSACTGGGGMLARLSATGGPQLAFSVDNLPNITLRNTGATEATALQVSASGYTLTSSCGGTLPAGAECDLALAGGGPGSVTASSANASQVTAMLGATTSSAAAIAVAPKELDFGIDNATTAARSRTLTITNLTAQAQLFTSQSINTVATSPYGGGSAPTVSAPYTLTEDHLQGDCIPVGDNAHDIVPAGATCHVVLVLRSSPTATTDQVVNTAWTVGSREVAITGYLQLAAVSLSATHIGFGRQYDGGLRIPRYLYLSNGSDAPQPHTAVALPSGSPFGVTDTCPATLAPQSVCRIALTYNSTVFPSSDSTSLALDNGLSVLVDGETLPAQSVTGTSVNPNLVVTPASVVFANPVAATTVSTETQTVTLTNAGAAAFALSTTASGDFTASTCPASLAAGANCVVTLHFTPSDAGARQGLFSATAGSAAPVYVPLSGQGTAITTPPTGTAPTSSPILNGTISFGEQPVGVPVVRWSKIATAFQTLTVTSSTADYRVLIVEDQGYGYGQPDRNAFQQAITGSCFNCYVGVEFLATATGPRPGTLTLATTSGGAQQSVTLTGTGRPTTGVLFSPVLGDFGSVAVGSASASTNFVLTNATGAPLTTGTPSVVGDFAASQATTGAAACGGTLMNGESCLVPVVFSPLATGTRAGQVTVPTGAGAATSPLTGVGVAGSGIGFSPDAVIFNNTPGSQATTAAVTVTNGSGTAITLGAPASNDSHFAAASTCTTIAAGATCSFNVVYTPTSSLAAGLLTLPVTSTANGATQTVTYQLPLSGSYTQETASIQIVPGEDATIHFGALATGTVSGVRVLRVNSLSTTPVTVQAVAPRQFPIVASTCGALAPGSSCELSVVYAPLINGDALGTVYVQATPTDGSATLNGLAYLEGYGLASAQLGASGNFSPTGVLDFGQVNSGGSSSQAVTLTNRGSGNITVRRVHVDLPFSATTDCGAMLSANASCTLTISYSPTASASPSGTQADTGVLTVESDAENAPLLLDLVGRAAAGGTNAAAAAVPLSLLALSQGALTFSGTAAVGTASATQTLVVSNAGTSVVHFTGVLTGPDFTVANGCAALNPGASCTLGVTFTPQSTGTRSSALEIQTDVATSLDFVSLLGTGTAASVALSPGTLDFGSVLLGRTSTLSATFTNNGSTPVQLGAVSTNGDFNPTASGNACTAGSTLAAGASCTVALVFSPTQAGTRSGTLTVASNATALPLTVTLTGIGTQPQLLATPNGLAFGDVLTGKSAQLSLTLANGSASDVNGLAFSITGDFAAVSTCGPGTLRAQSSCAITVAFAPTALGVRTGTLTVTSSDPSSPLQIPLTGNGIQGGGFSLTANGVTIASATTTVALPVSYALAVTQTGGFTGAVALTCTPQGTYAYVSCSITPSTVTLGTGPETSTATITTVTGAVTSSLTQPMMLPDSHPVLAAVAACLLAPWVLFIRRRRFLRVPLLLLLFAVALSATNGCGSGVGDKRIRYAAPGSYQFTVTASSTTGVTASQTVTLNLTIGN